MDIETAYKVYDRMVQIRLVEEAIVKEYHAQEIRTPVHLYLGQEAIAAAVSVNLAVNDFIVSNHRSHGHCLAKGLELDGFFKELYGKKGGVSGGWGGSMHLRDMDSGIIGTSAIVAGGIPIGIGVALKQKIKKEPWITVIYFGDGAVDEGVFWEAVNFSGLKQLPVLFVMENNRYASQTCITARHSYTSISNIIQEFGTPSYEIDGNNAVHVFETASRAIEDIRQGGGPRFIECLTYRWMGHVGINDDTDTGYRTRQEYDQWREKCPLDYMEKYLRQEDGINALERINEMKAMWSNLIAKSIKSAKEAPYAVD